jgi:hypothetical protein
MTRTCFICLFLLTIPFIGLAQNAGPVEVRFYNNFDDPRKNSSWMNSNTIVLDSDTTRKYVSRTNAENSYSAGIDIEIPAELKRKNFRIMIKCDVNMKPGSNNQLVISITQKDSAVFWDGLQLGESTNRLEGSPSAGDSITRNDTRTWYTIKMASLIPANLPADSKIKIYIWNADGKSETDVDDMEITFTETPLTSFLPK